MQLMLDCNAASVFGCSAVGLKADDLVVLTKMSHHRQVGF